MRKLLIVLTVSALFAGAGVLESEAYEDGAGFSSTPCDLGDDVAPGSGDVLEVGAGKPYATIKAAYDAASANDTILVHPGEYHESVRITKEGLRIRGTDRDAVILDGRSAGGNLAFGMDVRADRVVVENMTGRLYQHTAFYWTGVVGYWGRNLTAYNNGLYGIYAFDSRCGQFNDSYTSGNADSGFYIGECFTCDAVIHDVVAEQNALGYSGTNAGGNLTLRDSVWRDNAMGIAPNSLDGEANPPQRGAEIINNLIVDNNRLDAPGAGIAGTYWGVGVVIAGGSGNIVANNTVTGHGKAGIAITPLPDVNVWVPSGNTIWKNVVEHDAEVYPDAYDLAQAAGSGPGNCWEGNTTSTGGPSAEAPVFLQTAWACFNQTITPPGGDPRVEAELVSGAAGLNGRTVSDWRTWPAPAATHPDAWNDLVDADCDVSHDCALGTWLPALF